MWRARPLGEGAAPKAVPLCPATLPAANEELPPPAPAADDAYRYQAPPEKSHEGKLAALRAAREPPKLADPLADDAAASPAVLSPRGYFTDDGS